MQSTPELESPPSPIDEFTLKLMVERIFDEDFKLKYGFKIYSYQKYAAKPERLVDKFNRDGYAGHFLDTVLKENHTII